MEWQEDFTKMKAVKELLADKMQLASMEQACKNFDKSDGCAKIVSLMKDMIK